MARLTKTLKLFVHIIFFITVSYIVNREPIKSVKKVERFLTDMKHLLLWSGLPALEEEGQQLFIKQNCHYKNCYLTRKRNLLKDVRYFDAIIFNLEDVANQDWDLPRGRSKLQKYIFAASESADIYPVCSPVYENMFNWTWTYRLDSSIPYKMITIYNTQNRDLGNNVRWIYQNHMKPVSKYFKLILQTKSKAAAIFLDECKSQSKREVFLKTLQKELSKYNLTVDVFGKCGTLKCDKRSMQACYYRITNNYYFYLALEKSLALDYVTDLVLNGYNNNAVPIVYSGAQYDRFLPPHSYLDAKELGAEKLAINMNKIIQNKDLYYDLFRWKNHYLIKKGPGMDVCTLCSYMNDPKWLKMLSSYGQFRLWWNSDYRQRCSE